MRIPEQAAARVRGAFVGSTSGAVSIAAHAIGGGALAPGSSTLALLIAACALVGVVVAAVRPRYGVAEVMGMLAVGQVIGHAALAISPEHQHGPHAPGSMIAAHAVAIPLGALLIRGAELAFGRAVSSVRRAVRVLEPRTETAGGRDLVATSVAPLARRLLFSSGIGTRGPPVVYRPLP